MTSSQRGRRSTLAALGLFTLLATAACGSASPKPAGAAVTPAPSVASQSKASAGTSGTFGRQVQLEAIDATKMLHSYSFSSVQSVGHAGRDISSLTGQAVRPTSVSYSLTANGRQTHVMRLPAGTFVRAAAGGWSRLRRPSPAVDPVSSLVTMLQAISRPTAARAGSASTTLHGTIAAVNAHDAGLATGSSDAAVTVILDAQHRVTSLTVSTLVTRPGSRPVRVTVHTRYGAFNAVPPLRSPVQAIT